MANRFLNDFLNLIKENGNNDISKFVNKWIKEGGTFQSLYEWCILKDIDVAKGLLWRYLRPFLTIPYSYRDRFFYKWNAVALAKGFVSAKSMARRMRKNLTSKEICEELEITPYQLSMIFWKIKYWGKKFTPRKRKFKHYQVRRDPEGFTSKSVKERWKERFKKVGCKTLKDFVKKYRERNYSSSQMAKLLKVKPANFAFRLKKAKINLLDYPIKRKNKPTL